MEKLTTRFIDQCRDCFEKSFYWGAVAVLESNFPESWLSPKIHWPICDMISDYKTNPRAVVVLPRDWLKSQLCSIYYPIWRAMLDPNFTSLIIQNTFTNATNKITAIRSVLKNNQLLQQLYPERMPTSGCKQSSEALELPRLAPLADAAFEAAGVGTAITSRHFELLIEDDTVAPEFDKMSPDVCEPSEEQVAKAVGFHRQAHFLLHDFKTSQRLVVCTRWRELDLIAWIQREFPDLYTFTQRAVRENDKGEPDPDGVLTYPERFDDEVLSEIHRIVGDYMFQALMMNMPLAGKDAIFQRDDLQVYEKAPLDLAVFTTVDPAPHESKGVDPDFNVVMTCGVSLSTGRIYILDYFRERCTPGELIEALFNHVDRFSPLKVGIETVAYQKALEWFVKEEMNKRRVWFMIEPLMTSNMKKIARIRALQPIAKNKALFLRSWMEDLIQEFIAFPRGAHDDLLDALAYQIQFWGHVDRLQKEQRNEEFDRFTGGAILEELHGRMKRPKGFPYDMMGVTKDGQSLAALAQGPYGDLLFQGYYQVGAARMGYGFGYN